MATVLIADDERSIRLTMAAFLEGVGHQTCVAATAAEAHRIIEEQRLDVAVIDIVLGEDSGLAVARDFHTHQPNAQIVLITGRPDMESAREAIRLRVHDYAAKPVDRDQLVEMVDGAALEKLRRDDYDVLDSQRQEHVESLQRRVQEDSDALVRSENRFEELAELVPVGIFLMGTDGHCIYASPLACRIGGRSEDELLGNGWIAGLHPDDRERVLNTWQRVLDSGDDGEVECRVVSTTNEVRWVALRVTTQRTAEGKVSGYIGTAMDITALKEAETLVRQNQRLDSLCTLARGVAHEISNPLNGIMNYAQLIKDEQDGPGSAATEYAGEIIAESHRIASLCRSLLQFSRQKQHAHRAGRISVEGETGEFTRFLVDSPAHETDPCQQVALHEGESEYPKEEGERS